MAAVAGFDLPVDDWRNGIARWTREQFAIMQRHPWLEEVRHIDRAGTPSQITWMDLGLRALSGTPIAEYQKIELLLLLSGYVFAQARTAATAIDGARQGSFAVEQATQAFGELLRTIVDAERFPALAKTVDGGGFAGGRPFPDFDFGLDLILDGIACLVRRQTPD